MPARAAIIATGATLGATALAVALGPLTPAPPPTTIAGEAGPGAALGTFASQGYECPYYTILEPAPAPRHQFYFTRGQYSDYRGWRGRRRGGGSWSTDFEKADRQFLVVLRRLVDIDAFPCENTVSFDDPAVFRFPYIYILEVGNIRLTDDEARGFREWLLRGGFLHVDDFWGLDEWRGFAQEMERLLPEYPIVELSLDHEIFRTLYHVKDVLQIPQVGLGCNGTRYWEDPSDTAPRIFGIFDENERLMVVITYNSDLGDAWEWAEQACYPVDRSTWAFQVGTNFIVYALSH